MPRTRHLPPGWMPEETTIVGLISDTHLPDRRRRLPATLSDVFAGVDLLLHAGDVGDLRVLDELSAIAPVIAVHGNDDSVESQTTLPFQQIIAIAGQRILLWHSHFPDREQEIASRHGDDMLPKLARSVTQARQARASIVVFGHWHIPLVYRTHDVTVINPGALASGNAFTRMLHHTVALLMLRHDGVHAVVHIDLATPHTVFEPTLEFAAGFHAAMLRYSASILSPDVESLVPYLRRQLTWADLDALHPIVSKLGHPIWEGEDRLLTFDDYTQAFDAAAPTLAPDLVHRVRAAFQAWRSESYPR